MSTCSNTPPAKSKGSADFIHLLVCSLLLVLESSCDAFLFVSLFREMKAPRPSLPPARLQSARDQTQARAVYTSATVFSDDFLLYFIFRDFNTTVRRRMRQLQTLRSLRFWSLRMNSVLLSNLLFGSVCSCQTDLCDEDCVTRYILTVRQASATPLIEQYALTPVSRLDPRFSWIHWQNTSNIERGPKCSILLERC